MQISGVGIDAWEAETLVQMSKAYMSERFNGAKDGAIEPIHQTGDTNADRKRQTAAGIRAVLKNAGKP